MAGTIIYRGPSMLNGDPIIAIAIGKSGNTKTGNMVQTYIIRDDMDPLAANKSGADAAVCGSCPHRGTPNEDPKRKLAKDRVCYVNMGQGPLIVWKSLQRGIYPTATGHDAIAAIGRGRMVRIGTYGDGAAVPGYVWQSLLSEAKGHTAYSHQSADPKAAFDAQMFMVSADSHEAALDAWAMDQRTFRVIGHTDDMVASQEVLCPASEEAGRRTTCDSCGLCGGSSVHAKSIAIVVHGNGAGVHARKSA